MKAIFLLAALAAAMTARAWGAAPPQPGDLLPATGVVSNFLGEIETLLGMANSGTPPFLEGTNIERRVQDFSKRFRDPDVLNGLLGRLTGPVTGRPSPLSRLINDLHIKFKAFDAVGANQDASIGLEYSYDKSLAGHAIGEESNHPLLLSFNFAAQGNVAFDREANPDDFLDTKLQFHLFQSLGGVVPSVLGRDQFDAIDQAIDAAAGVTGMTEAEFDASPEWGAVTNLIVSRLRTQYFYDLSGQGALEANQSFSQKQWAYGAQLGGVIRAWNDDSAWAKFNLFDWPFAALRVLTGADRQWRPSGRALPSVLAGIDLVDPFDNDTRLAVDPDDGAYPRFRGEVAFKTKVARLMERDVWLSASYRYHRELGASRAIRAAEMDTHAWFAASLEFLGAFSLNYSNGKLPLDREEDQVFALGYSLTF